MWGRRDTPQMSHQTKMIQIIHKGSKINNDIVSETWYFRNNYIHRDLNTEFQVSETASFVERLDSRNQVNVEVV